MASLLRVPEVAAGATEATLAEWLVEEDSAFTTDQPIVVIETDKAIVEVPAGSDAVLLRRLVRGGTPIEVGAPIALVGSQEERGGDLDKLLAELGIFSRPSADSDGDAAGTDPPPTGSVRAPSEPPNGSGRVFISPIARRILGQAGLTADGIAGTGPGGRIVRRDAEKAVERNRRAAADPPPAERAGRNRYRDIPHSRVRRAIAARLTASKQSTPHFYLKRTARVDALLDLRRGLNAVSAQRISVNDLLLRAVAVTHAQVPEANAIWTEEAVRVFESVDVGTAIASQRGLVTPVLRDVQDSTPAAIAGQVREFVRLADEGKLAQRDLEGGTITVTNLGMYGVEEFAAIINPPQSAILAAGVATAVPVAVDGAVEVATVMTLVLSADHRVIDGALAARWMDVLVRGLEEPLRLLA